MINTTHKRLSMTYLITAVVLLWTSSSYARHSGEDPPDVQAVLRYMNEEEYPERYGEKQYKVRVRGYEIVDIDRDGTREVFLWIDPYYHQTPPILIYQMLDDGTVRRVKEGLAPGPLVVYAGHLQDTHHAGVAADLSIPDSGRMEKRMLIRNYLKFRIQIVAYKQFFHTAKAADNGGYVDMTHHTRYTEEDRNTCSDIQFSPVDDIGSGHFGDTDQTYFVALTGEDIYIYNISGINGFGFLNKTVWKVKKPRDFTAFLRSADGRIRYRTDTNDRKELTVAFENILPLN